MHHIARQDAACALQAIRCVIQHPTATTAPLPAVVRANASALHCLTHLLVMLHCSVVLDFGGALAALQQQCLAYRDLSPSGSSAEAARALFDALRWAEGQSGAVRVIMAACPCDPATAATSIHDSSSSNSSSSDGSAASLAAAVNDRMHRAAAGKVVVLQHADS
jgi:Putative GTP-binding controlling metal-binding